VATVLVIDDDDDVRRLLARALAQTYDVLEAGDAEAAFEVLASHTPDLILCDVMLPAMNGLDFVRHLRARDGGRQVPVIFLTAKTSAMDVVEGINAGARAYVAKPFKLAPLLERIARIVASGSRIPPPL
jgi:DNA-binding response OmpR family regulator